MLATTLPVLWRCHPCVVAVRRNGGVSAREVSSSTYTHSLTVVFRLLAGPRVAGEGRPPVQPQHE